MKEIKINVKKKQEIDVIWNEEVCKLLSPDNYFLQDTEIIFRIAK